MPNLPQPCWDLMIQYLGREKAIASCVRRDWRFEECRACVNRLLKNMVLICTGWSDTMEQHINQIAVCRNYAEIIRRKRLTPQIRSRVMISEIRIRQKRGRKVDRQRVAMLHCFRQCRQLLGAPANLLFHPRVTYLKLMPHTMRVR